MQTGVKTKKRIPSLDGIRAVAIFFVLVEHGPGRWVSAHDASSWLDAFLKNGRLGVTAFFVLSGYLITMLLRRESEESGRISLGNFFARRAFRLYPVFYTYLTVVAIMKGFGFLDISNAELASAGSFTWNYFGLWGHKTFGEWYLGHFWSLAVEQQFYLLWPLVIIAIGLKRAGKCAITLTVLMPVIRVAAYLLFPAQRGSIGMMFHTCADAVMVGCVIAIWEPTLNRWFMTWPRLFSALAAMAAFMAIFVFPWFRWRFRGAYDLPFGYTLDVIAAGFVLLFVLNQEKGFWPTFFRHPAVRHVGLISYSLYVWQQLFLGSSFLAEPLGVFWGVAAAVLCAELSWHLLEQPVQSWGNSLIQRHQRPVVVQTVVPNPSD